MKNNEVGGFILYNICTNPRPGLYIENLFIKPVFRRQGLGKALFDSVAAHAKEKNYSRTKWWIAKLNHEAMNFYHQLGAIPLNDWQILKVNNNSL